MDQSWKLGKRDTWFHFQVHCPIRKSTSIFDNLGNYFKSVTLAAIVEGVMLTTLHAVWLITTPHGGVAFFFEIFGGMGSKSPTHCLRNPQKTGAQFFFLPSKASFFVAWAHSKVEWHGAHIPFFFKKAAPPCGVVSIALVELD